MVDESANIVQRLHDEAAYQRSRNGEEDSAQLAQLLADAIAEIERLRYGLKESV